MRLEPEEKPMNTLTLTLCGMQNNMDREMNKKLERIMKILEWQTSKIQLLEREVIALKAASPTGMELDEEMELDIDEEMELDIDEEMELGEGNEMELGEGNEMELGEDAAKKVKKVKKVKTRGGTSSKMTTHEEYLYDRLCTRRRKQAVKANVSVYLIFNNDQLERIAKSSATTIPELLEIKGVGKIKSEKYGGMLLRLLSERNV